MELNKDMIKHMQKLPLEFFSDKDLAYYNQRIYSDSSAVISFSVNTVLQLITNIIATSLTLYIVVKTNSYICLLFFIAIIIYSFQYKLTKKNLYVTNNELKEKQSEFYSILFEQLSNIKLIKIFNIFNIFDLKLKNSFERLYSTILKTQRVAFTFKSSQTILTAVVRIVLLIIGGFQFLEGNMTIGTLSVLLSYFSSVIASATSFIELGQGYITNLVSFNRLKELIIIEEEPNGNISLNEINTIKLEEITYGYKNKVLIENLNVNFEKGKIYCIHGHNGIGKTTLINVLLGLHHNYKGNVLINDSIDLKTLDKYHFREKACSYATQTALLFNDTFYTNLTLNKKSFDRNYLKKFIKDFGLINKFKLDSIISMNGKNISGGEMQKISLIRSFIDDKDILIYDEPTSYLDINSKAYFLEYLSKIKESKKSIIIIITHDDDLKQISDELIDLETFKWTKLYS